MKRSIAVVFGALLGVCPLWASSPLDVIAIVEKVQFEPGTKAPERVRVFGAFAFFDGSGLRFEPERGFLYFSLPSDADAAAIRREWADIAAAAATGEPIAFARYEFLGSMILRPGDAEQVPLRVNALDAEAPVPVAYHPAGTGVVRIGEGNYDAIVAELRALSSAPATSERGAADR